MKSLTLLLLNAYFTVVLAILRRLGGAERAVRLAWWAAVPPYLLGAALYLASAPFVFVWRLFEHVGRYWDRYLVGSIQDSAELCGKVGDILRDKKLIAGEVTE